MRAFIELCVKGNRRIIIEPSSIIGVMTSANGKKDTAGTTESPVLLLLRDRDPIEIIGLTATLIFAQMCVVAEKVEQLKGADSQNIPPIVIQWLDRDDD